MNSRVLLVAVAAAAACHSPPEEGPPGAAEPTGALMVEETALPVSLPVDGTVRAQKRADLSTRMMARIQRVDVEVGDRVRADQVILRLGVEDVTARRSSAEAALAAAEAGRAEAVRHAARMDTLYSQDAVPRVQRDAARLALTQAESHLVMARSAATEAAVAEGYALIAAPFDGYVVARRANAGDVAIPGIPLMTVAGDGPREAVLAVPADVVDHLALGQPVPVTGSGGRSATARIRAIAAGADAASRTVEVLVELGADWPSGTAVSALVPIATRPGVAIPARAVVRRGQLTGVRVVGEGGVGLRWIRLGRSLPAGKDADSLVEVVSGLVAGERIVP